MWIRVVRLVPLLLLAAAGAFIAGCYDETGTAREPLQDLSLQLQVSDFGSIQGFVHGTSRNGLTYFVTKAPARGAVSVEQATGAFVYTPTSYEIGEDSFSIDYYDSFHKPARAEFLVTLPAGLSERPANKTCVAPARPPSLGAVMPLQVFLGIGRWDLISIYQEPGQPDYWYGIVKQGQVIRFENRDDVADYEIVLDISDRVLTEGESGLIGLVFHPEFETNGRIFLYWVAVGDPIMTYLSEFTSNDGGLTLDPASERVLLSLAHTTSRHKGGHMEFGPDGYLYLGIGDGGPSDQAQDVNSLFGTMIRIDPDGGDPYAIPADNPFAAGGGAPEIYAWGFRNPWRWSFDRATGDLWLGDVGRNSWEEVDIVKKGGNYGWPILEGNQCHPPEVATCNSVGMTNPVFVYPHGEASTAIIGGFVYDGKLLPELKGKYVFADIGRKVLVLENQPDGSYEAVQLVDSGLSDSGIWSLSRDLEGEMYVVKPDGIFRLVPNAPVFVEDLFPKTLSETGCFLADDPAQPASGVLPYDLNLTFWSNGALKERFMAIPDGESIVVDPAGDWEFPIGSVLSKVFYFDGAPVETRLLVRHDDGGWAGYAYLWRDDGSDADLISGAVSLADKGHAHTVPSRAQCSQCHLEFLGGSLGPENLQMNKFVRYETEGPMVNQVATLKSVGIVHMHVDTDPADIPRLPSIEDNTVDIETRARAYLHANCSNCHQPGGPGRGAADFRFSNSFAQMNLCNKPVQIDDFGITGVAMIVPGHPELSAVNIRIGRLELGAMPPVGKQALDEAGIILMDDFVTGLETCE